MEKVTYEDQDEKPNAAIANIVDYLIRMMPPMAIRDDVQHANYLEVIDRLMQIPRLSAGQADYLETLVNWWRHTKTNITP